MGTSATIPPPAAPYAIIKPILRGAKAQPISSELGEEELAAGLRARDPQALEQAYERFGRVTFGFLVKTLRDRGTAEDVQQQVFLEVWQRAPTYDASRAGLLTWVMTIARSRAIDALRRRVPEPIGGAEQPQLERHRDTGVEDVEVLVERYRFAGLLAELHPQEAAVLRMRFYEQLSQREIAEQTGMPLGTVKLRMVQGLERLRTMIEAGR